MKIDFNSNIFYFAKLRDCAIIPSKTDENGCYDLYACFDEHEMIIPAHSIGLIPTGIASAFSPKYRISLRERGSNTKSNSNISAGQIDSGYRGEYFVAVRNDNSIPVEITKGVVEVEKTPDFIRIPYTKAICQFAIEEVPDVNIEEVTYEELKKIPSKRGLGKLGSSGK